LPRVSKSGDRRLDLLNLKYFATETRSPEFDVLKASPRFALAYNNGYVALFDGVPAAVVPADVVLTGVAAPAGVHKIRLMFRPASVKFGAVLSIAAGLCVLLCLWRK
jgi:uncharacterized membrane protein YfhO